jgi:hypothetical protein
MEAALTARCGCGSSVIVLRACSSLTSSSTWGSRQSSTQIKCARGNTLTAGRWQLGAPGAEKVCIITTSVSTRTANTSYRPTRAPLASSISHLAAPHSWQPHSSCALDACHCNVFNRGGSYPLRW